MLQPSRFEAQVALRGAAIHKAAALLPKSGFQYSFVSVDVRRGVGSDNDHDFSMSKNVKSTSGFKS